MSRPLEISLIRHGEIIKPLPDSLIGQTDVPLSDLGQENIDALGKKLSSKRFNSIFHSPLSRCKQSAEIINKYQQTELIPLDFLKEISLGDWDGLSKQYIKNTFPNEFRTRGENITTYTPPHGESFMDLQTRVYPNFLNLIKTCQAYGYSKIAIVAHAGVNRVIIAKITNTDLSDLFSIQQDYGSITTIICESNQTPFISKSLS